MAESSETKTDVVEEEKEDGSAQESDSKGLVAAPKFLFGQNMGQRVQLKRQADKQLDPDSINEEDDESSSEEGGMFSKASPNVLAKRPIAVPSNKSGNIGQGSNQSFVAATSTSGSAPGFPMASKPLFATSSPPGTGPPSPTSTAPKTGTFSGQALSFSTAVTTSTTSVFSSSGNVPSFSTSVSTNAFQSQNITTSASSSASVYPPQNSSGNVFAAQRGPPLLTRNVFATHQSQANSNTPTTSTSMLPKSEVVSTTPSGQTLTIPTPATRPSISISSGGAVNVASYRTIGISSVGSGYSSVENSDTEQDEFKPALKIRPMSIRPVFSTAEESWGESASCKVLLRPSSLPGPFKLKAPSLTAPDTKSPSQTSIQNEPVESVENGTDKISEKQSEQLEAKSKTVEKKENGKNSEALTSNSSTSSSKENFFMKLAEPEASNTWAGTQIVPGKITSTEKLFTTNKESTSKENYWTQCNSIQAKSLDDVKEEAAPKVNSSSGFVFGRMMNERVCTPKKRKIDGEEEESNRSKTSPSSTKILSKLAKSDNEESQDESSETKDIDSPPAKSLVESAIAYEEAKESNRLKLDEVPVVTGEESEENVIQAQCKLFLFEPDSYSWLEKGRGTLRINDQSQSSKALSFQSRIVMRTQGSLRVILNAKIWHRMSVEKASPKSVRITTLDSDGVKVYLIMANPKDSEQIFSAIDYRVHALKKYDALKKSQSKSEEESPENDIKKESESQPSPSESDKKQ